MRLAHRRHAGQRPGNLAAEAEQFEAFREHDRAVHLRATGDEIGHLVDRLVQRGQFFVAARGVFLPAHDGIRIAAAVNLGQSPRDAQQQRAKALARLARSELVFQVDEPVDPAALALHLRGQDENGRTMLGAAQRGNQTLDEILRDVAYHGVVELRPGRGGFRALRDMDRQNLAAHAGKFRRQPARLEDVQRRSRNLPVLQPRHHARPKADNQATRRGDADHQRRRQVLRAPAAAVEILQPAQPGVDDSPDAQPAVLAPTDPE